MGNQLELEWLGGPTEARMRRRRPGADDLPWGTLKTGDYSPSALVEARKIWTNGCFTEYASAAGFTAFATALLESGAPIDLAATAADFAVDELDHAELAARLTTELGGATPYEVELEKVSPYTTPGVRALVRAAEIAIKTSCVGEALSVPVLAQSMALANQPLVSAVLERLLRDEGPHAKVGQWFFEWSLDRFTPDETRHLGEVALEALEVYAPLWLGAECEACKPAPSLGGAPHDDYQRTMRAAARERVVAPLQRMGLALDRERLLKLELVDTSR